jgi:hypothetical protein
MLAAMTAAMSAAGRNEIVSDLATKTAPMTLLSSKDDMLDFRWRIYISTD